MGIVTYNVNDTIIIRTHSLTHYLLMSSYYDHYLQRSFGLIKLHVIVIVSCILCYSSQQPYEEVSLHSNIIIKVIIFIYYYSTSYYFDYLPNPLCSLQLHGIVIVPNIPYYFAEQQNEEVSFHTRCKYYF